jgi:hypothetical protein
MTTDPRCLVCRRPDDACRNCPAAIGPAPRCNCNDCDICDERCVVVAGGDPARVVTRTFSIDAAAGSPDDDGGDPCATSSVDVVSA